MIHITCNMGSRDLPDMYALRPAALGLQAYISGKSLLLMLKLIQMFTIPIPGLGGIAILVCSIRVFRFFINLVLQVPGLCLQ